MRTNIEIDDALMVEAQKASGHATKKQTVEEALRYDAPVQMNQRIALEPCTLSGGEVVQPGEQMIVMLAAANRDPEAFTDPYDDRARR